MWTPGTGETAQATVGPAEGPVCPTCGCPFFAPQFRTKRLHMQNVCVWPIIGVEAPERELDRRGGTRQRLPSESYMTNVIRGGSPGDLQL